jgi:hypothetical protein
MTQLQDLYNDYLISATQLATVTTASEVLGVSKDKLSRFLGGVELFTSNQSVNGVEQKKGYVKDHIAFDNQVQHTPYCFPFLTIQVELHFGHIL